MNRKINPTQVEHNVLTPEINQNSDEMWLQMSQFAEKTQKQFAELQASLERMKTLTASMDKTVKTLQEGQAWLSRASEQTKKRLNLAFEEQQHSKRGRDCLHQDINKLFDIYHHQGKYCFNCQGLTSHCTSVSIKSCFSCISVTL
ncbi:hypothetical protein O181_059117 [Austropuccinia psidii MF-1]|uniref:Uncharacterized protein n=1 Tax=Austropuccinia psidii MF-1 TaxID=1389203 RepID=A0A9Q3HX44_9BASI|nr:hypothetical protein [Austropuccinia psidii MF-1]